MDTTEYQNLACLWINDRGLRSTVDELVKLAYEAGRKSAQGGREKSGPAEAPASPVEVSAPAVTAGRQLPG